MYIKKRFVLLYNQTGGTWTVETLFMINQYIYTTDSISRATVTLSGCRKGLNEG